MSRFAARMAHANSIVDEEFADTFHYEPMREVVNGEPIVDESRTAGMARAVITTPGVILGTGHSLNAMHSRSDTSPNLFFMVRGLLTDVRKFDRLTILTSPSFPERVGKRYEIAGGPRPMGFGRHRAELQEVDLVVPPPVP